jgi:hypothetical protein
MAVSVKDVTASAQKFVQRAQAAGPAYSAGVANAGTKWANNTKASAQTYALGVQDAVANGRYAAGINTGATNKYQTRASGVGAQRYPQGVAGAQESWASSTQPYLQTIANLNLPPRQPKGSAANYQRVQAVGDALRAKKLSSTGQ